MTYLNGEIKNPSVKEGDNIRLNYETKNVVSLRTAMMSE